MAESTRRRADGTRVTGLSVWDLIDAVTDLGSFQSWDQPVNRARALPGYRAELERAGLRVGTDEAVLTGKASIRGNAAALVVSEFGFLGGSIGTATAARITAAFRRATAERLPLIAAPSSGGTRMQEGTPAFVQMAEISRAVVAHKAAGLPYLVYLRDPTVDGVFASWGSLGHVTVAEPGALIGSLGSAVYQILRGNRSQKASRWPRTWSPGASSTPRPHRGARRTHGRALVLLSRRPGRLPPSPLAAPVLGPVRLRGGSAGSARGAAGLTAEAIGAAREAGCAGKILVRFDSASCNSAVIRTVIRRGVYFSVTVPMNSSVRAAIAAIPEDAWTPIAYPQAVWDDQLGCWASDAEVAETRYTAFTSKPKKEQVTARLIVRRVRARNDKEAREQGELFPVYRHHAERHEAYIRGCQLAEMRQATEITQAELAVTLGVSQARVCKIEHGENSGIDVVRAYIHALGGHLDVVASIGDRTWRLA